MKKDLDFRCNLRDENGKLSENKKNTLKLFQFSLVFLYDGCKDKPKDLKVDNGLCMEIASGKVKLKDLIFFPGDYEVEDFKRRRRSR